MILIDDTSTGFHGILVASQALHLHINVHLQYPPLPVKQNTNGIK